MTDRVSALTVVLSENIRIDDVEPLMAEAPIDAERIAFYRRDMAEDPLRRPANVYRARILALCAEVERLRALVPADAEPEVQWGVRDEDGVHGPWTEAVAREDMRLIAEDGEDPGTLVRRTRWPERFSEWTEVTDA